MTISKRALRWFDRLTNHLAKPGLHNRRNYRHEDFAENGYAILRNAIFRLIKEFD
jgi:hypothetical protein